jgi:hypothetical protein
MNTTYEPLPLKPAPPPVKEKRVYTLMEKLLLLAALGIAVLLNRLLLAPLLAGTGQYPLFFGAFWLCFLAVFTAFLWKRLRRGIVFWYVAGCAVALCAWAFIFWEGAARGYFGLLNHMVIPGVLMAFAMYATHTHRLKNAGALAVAWLNGWFVRPFSGIPHVFGALGSLFMGENKSTVKKALLGVGITLPLLFILLPLLAGADQAFGYHLSQILARWNFASLVGHSIFTAIAFLLFYSFLWNANATAKETPLPQITARIGAVVSSIVLGTVVLLYVVFCVVMFTYLFAGAGLPGGMTYYAYARQGFSQTVTVCVINLLLYGVFLHYGTPNKIKTTLLAGLLVLTGVMLFSGFVRLGLYIDAFGMTWLRLISAWFIIYLSAVVVVCGVRIWKEKLPAIALCALILLGWYVVLGYLNPDGFVDWYNLRHGYDAVVRY